MGPDRAKALILALALWAPPVLAQNPGWHYSPLPGEGDRASLGCARGSTEEDFTCLAVRCEDDFSIGIHIHASRVSAGGRWAMTLDREDRVIAAMAGASPYGAKLIDDDGWLLERLRQGTFVYLRPADDEGAGFAYIDLAGSFHAIEEALYWCAPRVPAAEQNSDPGVKVMDAQGEKDESPPPGTQ